MLDRVGACLIASASQLRNESDSLRNESDPSCMIKNCLI